MKISFIKVLVGVAAVCCMSFYSVAGDSTAGVVSNLTSAASFSKASSGGTRRDVYNGNTSGRINFPSGYRYAYVNGNRHIIGLGYNTYIQNGHCTITVTDGYAQGCSASRIYKVYMTK